MLADRAKDYGEAGERALYWEIRNAMARYLMTCQGAGFNRALFGLVASGDEGRAERICRDVWRMTEGVSEKLDLRDELRVWNRAVQDAYIMSDPGAERRFQQYEERQ